MCGLSYLKLPRKMLVTLIKLFLSMNCMLTALMMYSCGTVLEFFFILLQGFSKYLFDWYLKQGGNLKTS